MKYIATVLLMLMAISLIFSGVLVWRRRKDTGDYSRTIWAIFSWISSIFALVLMLLYSFVLFLVPYGWSKSSADIQELFNYAGYRQRSTAWRNFQKVTGMTPAEFIEIHNRGPIL